MSSVASNIVENLRITNARRSQDNNHFFTVEFNNRYYPGDSNANPPIPPAYPEPWPGGDYRFKFTDVVTGISSMLTNVDFGDAPEPLESIPRDLTDNAEALRQTNTYWANFNNPWTITVQLPADENNDTEKTFGPFCILEGTPIETDQGTMAIELITKDNTINGQKVKELTEQTTTESLVLLKKGSLEENMPSQDTYFTGEHGIFLNGTMIKAKTLVDGENIVLADMDECKVYNVVLDTHAKMTVNNMEVETLDPEHPVAKNCGKVIATYTFNNDGIAISQ
jgi:hypothetical protein